MTAPAPTPTSAFAHQDEVFAAAFTVLGEAIAQRAFPAASVAVTHQAKLVALKTLGKFTYESAPSAGGAPLLADVARSGNASVTPATLFDLASLTKVLATTTMAALLYERGQLDLDAPVVGTLPEFLADSCAAELDPRRHDITLRMLLAHSSGLPAYEKLYLKFHTRDELLFAAITTPLSADPGTRAEYSDIGFIVLAAALERIAGESLDAFCQREIFGPLGMTHTTFNPPAGLRAQIPPTADGLTDERRADAPVRSKPEAQTPQSGSRSAFRTRLIQGEVQDENASVLGGVAGHAGLFATAEDLARFAETMLQGGNPILLPATVALFTRRESSPADTSRALGWDTPSSPSQSGKSFGPNSFGHLGYTGTSLWIDPDRQLSITLLTNRTWPDCSNQAIKQIRPKFHDAVVEALTRG